MLHQFLPTIRSLPNCLNVELLKGYKGDLAGVAQSEHDYVWMTLWASVEANNAVWSKEGVPITRRTRYWTLTPNSTIMQLTIRWSVGLPSRQRSKTRVRSEILFVLQIESCDILTPLLLLSVPLKPTQSNGSIRGSLIILSVGDLTMNILITSAASDLAQGLASALSGEHQIRLTDLIDVETDLEFVRSDLGHDEATNKLVQGIDAIVHVAQMPPSVLVRIEPTRKLRD